MVLDNSGNLEKGKSTGTGEARQRPGLQGKDVTELVPWRQQCPHTGAADAGCQLAPLRIAALLPCHRFSGFSAVST